MRTSEYARSRNGLYLPMHATLKGRVRWQVLDERGVPEAPRTESGFAIAPAEGVSQDNLITDLGMDMIAAYSALDTYSNAAVQHLRQFLAVGTGSATPDVTDTTLDNEVQRARDVGTFSDGNVVGTLDGTNNVWRAESTVTRLVTMSADRNLTEFGFSPSNVLGIGIRELLRNSEGTPVTVSLLNGKMLRVNHTMTVELPAPSSGHSVTIAIKEYDAGNNLVGSTPQDIIHGGHANLNRSDHIAAAAPGSTTSAVIGTWLPHAVMGMGVRRIKAALTYARIQNINTSTYYDPTGTAAMASLAAESYVPGSYQRIKRAVIPAGSGNAAWYGVTIDGTYTPRAGWHILFDDPSTYTKQNTDTLQFGLISSWARA